MMEVMTGTVDTEIGMRGEGEMGTKRVTMIGSRTRERGRMLNDLRGKEWLVHVSQIANKRVVTAKEASTEEDELAGEMEEKQLVASGVLKVNEYPMYDEEGDGMLYQDEGAEEELEIELNEDEPAFCRAKHDILLICLL
ncbi:hypothetical protein MLD38_030636 [Melastoma candidum]|uniref:Uncharacterized protein n=1 Tax=Melastoma candidum TaxID=119954 RepID=A0ACB9MP59_9MYRT|nr:hypothetical protein MLD38_030636 [Melastoma candidum]